MKNIEQVRDQAVDIFNKMKAGEIDHSTCKELSNVIGKIVSTCTVQLKYAELRHEEPEIPFLNVDEEQPDVHP